MPAESRRKVRVLFPHSNGLKDVASSLGVNWTGNVTSGIDCIAARMEWEASKDSAIKGAIVDYNEKDCLALQRVANFLVSLGSSEATANPLVQQVSEIRIESQGRFGQINFALPEMQLSSISVPASSISETKFLFALTPPCGRVFGGSDQEHDRSGEPISK